MDLKIFLYFILLNCGVQYYTASQTIISVKFLSYADIRYLCTFRGCLVGTIAWHVSINIKKKGSNIVYKTCVFSVVARLPSLVLLISIFMHSFWVAKDISALSRFCYGILVDCYVVWIFERIMISRSSLHLAYMIAMLICRLAFSVINAVFDEDDDLRGFGLSWISISFMVELFTVPCKGNDPQSTSVRRIRYYSGFFFILI